MKKHIRKILFMFSFVLLFVLSACSTPTYVVIFDTNGGNAIASVQVKKDDLLTKPTDPVKEGFSFDGWFSDEAKTTPFVFAEEKITANITVYAKWSEAEYTISFESDGGTLLEDISVKHNALVSKPIDPTKSGYRFEGWYSDEAKTTVFNFITDRVQSNMTLYAKWTNEMYVVTFDSDGGTLVNDESVAFEALVTEPAEPTKIGHTFLGWFENELSTTPWNFNDDVVVANTNLIAKWQVENYLVSFDTDNGSLVDPISVDYNQLVIEPVEPEKTDYIFAGWFRDVERKVAFNFATQRITSPVTLYAKWTPVSIPVLEVADFTVRLDALETLDYLTFASATDSTDGDISGNIVVDSTAVKNEIGTYNVIYSITNSNNKTTTKTVAMTVVEATADFPNLDNRDFIVKTQNLARPVDTMVTATFAYDQITYVITDFQTAKPSNGCLQIEYVLAGYLKPNQKYILTFDVKASKNTNIMPYLQLRPVGYPYTNIMGNGSFAVTQEFTTISITFETGASVAASYSFSVEFGNAFSIGESGSMEFKNFALNEAVLVTFEADNGQANQVAGVVPGNTLSVNPTPTKTGYVFLGWYKDELKTIPWNFENDVVVENMSLYALYAGLTVPEISGTKNLEVRLEDLETLDYLEGVTAFDSTDGDLTNSIVVSHNVLPAVGTYQITYTVMNSLNEIDSVTVDLVVSEATREYPAIDSRDFTLKTQNLTRPVETMVTATFAYDQITYVITDYQNKYQNNGNLQIAYVLEGYLKPNQSYILSFDVKASKNTNIMPYLQVIPVAKPWTNIMGNGAVAVTQEFTTITIVFKTGATVAPSYSFSIEFGNAFAIGESGSIEFKNFAFNEAVSVTFEADNNQANQVVAVVTGNTLSVNPTPTKIGYEFVGWYSDASKTIPWDFENGVVVENMSLYAEWVGLPTPVITGAQDLTIRLNEVATYDFMEGISGFDSRDGDITSLIVMTKPTMDALGTYELTYTLTNSIDGTDTVVITVTVIEATRELPVLDNRDFTLKTQNLSRPVADMVDVTFGYEEISYVITDYQCGTLNNGNLQIEYILDGHLQANTTYTFTFDVKASKETQIMPYLQVYPVGYPYTNIMGNAKVNVTTEYQTITITFTTGASVAPSYNFSIEFGEAFAIGESGFINFKNFSFTAQ